MKEKRGEIPIVGHQVIVPKKNLRSNDHCAFKETFVEMLEKISCKNFRTNPCSVAMQSM